MLTGGAWAFAGKIVTGLSGVLISALLARLLYPEELAAYFLTFSLVSFIVVVVQLGMTNSIVRFVAEAVAVRQYARGRSAIQKSLLLTLGASATAGIVLLNGGWLWLSTHVAHSKLVSGVSLAGVCWMFLLAFQGLLAEIFRGFNDIKSATIFGGLTTALLSLAMFAGLYAVSERGGLDKIVLISVLAVCGSVLLALPFMSRNISGLAKRGDVMTAKELLTVSFPLWGSYLFLFVLLQADVWILAAFRPQSEVAIYGAASRLASLIALPLMVVNAVIPPIMANYYARDMKQELEKVLRTVATLSGVPLVIIILVLIPFGGFVLRLTFGSFYEAGAVAFTLLCIGQIVNVWMGSPGLLLVQAAKQRVLFVITLCNGVVTLLLLILLVRLGGYNGAAAASMLGVIFQNIATWFACLRIIGVDTRSYPPSKLPGLFAAHRHLLTLRVHD